MVTEPLRLSADVLVIGAGAAGLMAARAASAAGASVVLVDKSLIGRGGATIMAQMTTAVALGAAEPDSPELHAEDTLAGARGLGDAAVIDAICARGPEAIREVEGYGAPWARTADGRYAQVFAPGHSRKRCVYVDVLRTGEATSQALRSVIRRDPNVTRLANVMLTKLALDGGRVTGALGFAVEEVRPVAIAARTTIVATGGLTALYARTSASSNMSGDGFLLAAEAGARLRDMEMVQFFPIAHLAPPLVQLDPIMWDPFRYKLGGKLVNGLGEDFLDESGADAGAYTTPRDTATAAIFREVEAGRGSPHGGAYLDFRMVPREQLEAGFGPVIDILARQGIDLGRDMVEVAPMAHFMLGGIVVDPQMRTGVDGLLACGEAIGGMHGANRLSGNAITEALVTGRIAGEIAARERGGRPSIDAALAAEWDALRAFWHPRAVGADDGSVPALRARLQQVMWDGAGPLRTHAQLAAAQDALGAIAAENDALALAPQTTFAQTYQEKSELRIMIDVAQAIVTSALARRESRGAHLRLDHPEARDEVVALSLSRAGGAWTLHERAAVPA
jgi:succinate dehydrogenase / fumarate reductase flavoprotein subunit/fumarate reductase (CoM/CoB) subunit A